MVFSNPTYDVDHNRGQPQLGSPYESVRKPWQLIGRYHADSYLDIIYAPIGKRLLVTVGHISAFIGQIIEIQGQTYTVVSFQQSTYTQIGQPGSGNPGVIYGVDAVYVTVDHDIPQWFRRFQSPDTLNVSLNNLLLNISGGAGGQVAPDSEGWLAIVPEPDYAKSMGVRWSIQKCDYIGTLNNYPPNPAQPDPPPWFAAAAFFRHSDDPEGHPECASPIAHDSGSPVFIDCGPPNDPWVFLGCVSGPGSGVVSPYKGQVQTGTACSLILLDDETVRLLNGEPPLTGQPPPPEELQTLLLDFNGKTFWLIGDPQDGAEAFETAVTVFRDTTAGLSNEEARRPYSVSLRWRVRYLLTLDGAARLNLEAALDSGPETLFAAPLWPLALPATQFATSTFTAGVWVALDPARAPQPFSGGLPPGLSADAVVAPLLLGYLGQRKTEAIGPNTARLSVDLTESSDLTWAIAPDPFPMTAGPYPTFMYPAPPWLFDFFLDFEKLEQTWTLGAFESSIGFGREPHRTTYPQAPAREFQGEYVLPDLTEGARFLSFIRDHSGGQSFWTPAWKLAALIEGPIFDGQTIFPGANHFQLGEAIAFVSYDGIVTRTVTDASATEFQIDVGVGPYNAGQFGVHQLKLVRLRTAEQTILWLGNGVARGFLELREVPPELDPGPQSLSENLGGLPLRAYLYEFTLTIAGRTQSWLFTSFERSVQVDPFTGPLDGQYLAQQITHGEIRNSLGLERNEVKIQSANFPGNPLVDLAALRTFGTLSVSIWRCGLTGNVAENLEALFTGEFVAAQVTGSVITATAASGGSILDRRIPRFTYQPTCNHALFSPGCTLDREQWKFSAQIQNFETGFPFDYALDHLSGPHPVAVEDYFAAGWVEFGTGADFDILPIIKSSIPVGGLFTITLPRDAKSFLQVGYPATLFPGCDARRETCISKFNNYLNFGGHPYLPTGNPSIIKHGQTSISSGAKK